MHPSTSVNTTQPTAVISVCLSVCPCSCCLLFRGDVFLAHDHYTLWHDFFYYFLSLLFHASNSLPRHLFLDTFFPYSFLSPRVSSYAQHSPLGGIVRSTYTILPCHIFLSFSDSRVALDHFTFLHLFRSSSISLISHEHIPVIFAYTHCIPIFPSSVTIPLVSSTNPSHLHLSIYIDTSSTVRYFFIYIHMRTAPQV